MPNIRALIFEPDYTGHRYSYVAHLITALRDLPVDITLATSVTGQSSQEYNIHLYHLQNHFKIVTVPESRGPGPYKIGNQKLESLNSVLRAVGVDHCFVPYADHIAQVSGLMFSPRIPKEVELEGIIMRGGFAYPRHSLKHSAIDLLSKFALARTQFTRLHWIDPIAFSCVSKMSGRLSTISRIMPDPVPVPDDIGKECARDLLGIAKSGIIIGCHGVLDERKGVHLLINAFLRAKMDPTTKLLLAGRLNSNLRQLIERIQGEHPGKFIILDRYLTDAELNLSIIASDFVCAPYPSHIGSASIVLRAAAINRPVIGSNFGWISWAVTRFNLGWTVNVVNPNEFSEVLEIANRISQETPNDSLFKNYLDFYSYANFSACWTSRIRERLGLPQITIVKSPHLEI